VPRALCCPGVATVRALACGRRLTHWIITAGTLWPAPNAGPAHRAGMTVRRAAQCREVSGSALPGKTKSARRRSFMLTPRCQWTSSITARADRSFPFRFTGNHLCLSTNARHVSDANDRTLSPPRRLVSRTRTVPSSWLATSTQFADSEKELLRHVDAGVPDSCILLSFLSSLYIFVLL
jgi:hypothetical protein